MRRSSSGRPGVLLATAALGASLALGALGVVHRQLMPAEALAVGGLSAVCVALFRGPWAHLPLFVGLWLDLGVVVASALVASVAYAVSLGLPFTVLRAPELSLLFTAALLVGLSTAGLAYTHLRLADEVEVQGRRVAELERAALQSRLAALSAQIKPHFLFNTLNTVAELVHEDARAAEDLVTDLSAMMRAALRSATERVPLAEELDLVRRLLRVEAARLGDRLTWSVEGDEALPPLRVPGLLIQPLVENAVKYAAAGRAQGGRVEVRVVLGDTLEVYVVDDGPGLPQEIAQELAAGALRSRGTEGHGGGLKSCLERLTLTWPDGAARLRHHAEQPGTCLALELPLELPLSGPPADTKSPPKRGAST